MTITNNVISKQFGHPKLFHECLAGNYSDTLRLSDKRLVLNDLINIIIYMNIKNITAIKKVHNLYIEYLRSLVKIWLHDMNLYLNL